MTATTHLLASICIAIREPILATYIYEYLKEKKGYHCLEKVKHVKDVFKFKSKNTNITLYFDIHLNGVNNIYEAATITQQVAANKTIVLCNDLDIPAIEPLIKLNYIGYILKTNEPYQINHAIKKYRNDEPHTDHEIDNYYKGKVTISKEIQGPSGTVTLTDKEFEIISLLVQEFTPKIICKKLIMKMNTYKTHRTHICDKIHPAGFENIDALLTHLRNFGQEN